MAPRARKARPADRARVGAAAPLDRDQRDNAEQRGEYQIAAPRQAEVRRTVQISDVWYVGMAADLGLRCREHRANQQNRLQNRRSQFNHKMYR